MQKGAKKTKKSNSDDGEEYVLEGTSEKNFSKKGEKDGEGAEEHSELVYADSKSHSYRLDPNQDEDMKDGSEVVKDNVRTYEMNISAEDRTDPMYGMIPESDSSSNKESMRRREMKKQQKYGVGEFSMPKQMPYGNHPSYSDLFPTFCSSCFFKVDMNYISWSCRGHCGKVYHDRCKKSLDTFYRNKGQEAMNEPNEWICWLCREGKAECFICKQIDPVKWSPKKQIPFYIRNNPAGELEPSVKDPEKPPFDPNDSYKCPENRQKPDEPHLVKPEGEEQKETEFKFRFDNEEPFTNQKVSILPFISLGYQMLYWFLCKTLPS